MVMPPAPTPEMRERSARRTLWWIAGISGGVFLLIVARITSGNIEPRVSLPTPVLPNPNAFDVFVKAGKQCTPTKEAQDTLGDMVSRRPKKTWTLTEKEAFLQQNAPSLQTLRSGFVNEYQEPARRVYFEEYSHYADFRNMVRLLELEGDIHRAKGETTAAMRSYADAFQVGQKIPRGASLMGNLVGISCQATARRPVWETLPQLNVRDAKKAARWHEAQQSKAVSQADVLREEKYYMQAALLDFFGGKLPGSEGNIVGVSQKTVRPAYFIWSKRAIMGNCETFMDELIARSQKPYQAAPDLPPLPRDPINQVLLPIYDKARVKAVNNETQNALLTVALALQAYKMECKKFPAALSDLCPAYLSAIPQDPFALSGTISYKQISRGFVLYSVGPDGRDDNGTPISNNDPAKGATTGRNWHFVEKYSKGDIVAGVNQ